MSVKRTLLTLGVLVAPAIMFVACKHPADPASRDVRTAATRTVFCQTEDMVSPTGHIDWYQGGAVHL
jgi:hypothetical protein